MKKYPSIASRRKNMSDSSRDTKKIRRRKGIVRIVVFALMLGMILSTILYRLRFYKIDW